MSIFGVRQDIGHVHALALDQCAADNAAAPRLMGHVLEIVVEQIPRVAVARHVIVGTMLPRPEVGPFFCPPFCTLVLPRETCLQDLAGARKYCTFWARNAARNRGRRDGNGSKFTLRSPMKSMAYWNLKKLD